MLESGEVGAVDTLLLGSPVLGKFGRPYDAVEDLKRALEKRRNFEVSLKVE